MKEKNKPDIFFVLGWVMGLAVICDLAANLGDPLEILWFCNASALLLTIALFSKNTLLLTMILIMAVPAQFFWIGDFVLSLLGKGMGRTALLMDAGPVIYGTALVLHALIIPVSAYGVWHLGFNQRALGFAYVYLGLLLSISFFFTDPVLNHNCVFYTCDGMDTGEGYGVYFLYSLLSWSAIATASFYIGRMIFRNRLFPLKEPHG